MSITELFNQRLAAPSDINQHLPLLAELASECDHITEFGTRTGNSTIAFLYGIRDDIASKLESYDINPPGFEATEDVRHLWRFTQADTGKLPDIATTDMLFIDTLHTCEQVRLELMHGNRARKYLVFHDTVLFGSWEETAQGGGPGIMHPILCFLAANPHWRVKEHRANNCGLLVLERAK